jgi:hypothetical protein
MPNSKLFSEVFNIEHLTATTAPLRGVAAGAAGRFRIEKQAADFH